jgi:phosphoenolpyruvate carboxykinase (ATP)
MLGERIARHRAAVWLVNTGWTGGPYGTGRRMKIADTRAMIAAAFSGALDQVGYENDPNFNLDVPTTCPGVSPGVLKPRQTWANSAEYDAQARKLAQMFVENFKSRAGCDRRGEPPVPEPDGAAPSTMRYEPVIGLRFTHSC